MFDRFCRNSPCFIQQERTCEIEVPTLSQLQHTINRLPTFESQHPCITNANLLQDLRKIDQRQHKTAKYDLNRVKSQPELEHLLKRHPEKENHQLSASTKYRTNNKCSNQQSFTAYYNPFLADSYHHSQKSFHHSNLQRSTLQLPTEKITIPVIPNRSMLVNPSKKKPCPQIQSTKSVVSIEEYNRVMNLNMSLIKMIEEDYQPLRATCQNLEQQQVQRLRTIELLQRKVEELRQQLGSSGGVRRYY